MLCRCDTPNGETVEVYVKYKGFHEELSFDHLAGELIANLFALDMNIPAAKPCIVNISKEFIEVLPDDTAGLGLKAAFGSQACSAFGSIAFKAFRRWEASNLVHNGQIIDATRLYLFDTIVENSDRSISNPNLLVSGHDFKAIDFGHSFQRCHSECKYDDCKMPWEPGGILNSFKGDMQHVLLSGMKKVTVEAIEAFTNDLRDISDQIIEEYVTVVPEEWGDYTALKIVDYLTEARNNADAFEKQVRGVLL